MRTICDDRCAAIPPPSTGRRHKTGTAAPGGGGAAEMLQAVDQRSASSAGRRATAIGLAPWIVRPVLQRPASVAAHCCKARCPHCRTLLQPNGAVQQRDQGRAEPTQVDFAARLPQTASNGESDVAVSLRISTRKKISGYDRYETNPNLLLVQEVPGL